MSWWSSAVVQFFGSCASSGTTSRAKQSVHAVKTLEVVNLHSRFLGFFAGWRLVSGPNWIAIGKLYLEHSFTMDEQAALVLEGGDDFFRFPIDHIAAGG